MIIYAKYARLPFCCGVYSVGAFRTYKVHYNNNLDLSKIHFKSGTGLFTAEFINTNACKEAYETLCKHYTLLYQSPVKRNDISGSHLFMCVFSN